MVVSVALLLIQAIGVEQKGHLLLVLLFVQPFKFVLFIQLNVISVIGQL